MVTASPAERAWTLAKSRPAEAIELSADLLRRLDPDDPERPVALAARGRAHFELGANDRAIVDLREAADQTDGPVRSRALIALSAAIAAGGDSPTAATLLETVIETEEAGDAEATIVAMARSQLGLLRLHDGDMTGAIGLLERSIGPLRDAPDEHDALARVLGNAGCCHLVIGDLDRAVELFDEAVELGHRTDQEMVVVGCLQNKGYALSMLGDFPEALAQLDRAREVYHDLGGANRNLSTLYDDLADTYRLAGLTRDAVRHAEVALRSVEGGGNLEKEADALYRLAMCLLDDGDHRRAIDTAKRAIDLFASAGRSLWQTRATLIAVEAAVADGLTGTDEQIDDIERAAEDLDRAGWRTEALRLRNRVLLMGLASDDLPLIDRFLLDGAPDDTRSVVGQLECLLHRAVAALRTDGRADGLLAEASATLQAHRGRLADPELRAGSGRLAEAFRFLAISQEIAGGDPARILTTEERWRAASLHLPRARPSSDKVVAETTRQLREATRQAAEATEPDPSVEQRIQRLEERLRRASHQVATRQVGTGAGPDLGTAPGPEADVELIDRVTERLGRRRLVEWFGHGELLYAVDVDQEEAIVRVVGPIDEIRSSATRLRRDLARLLHAPRSGDGDRRWHRIQDRARDLGQHLFGGRAGPDGLVLSPPGMLQELPWPLLVPEVGTPLVITFSASSWLRSNHPIVEPAVHALAGPDLAHGAEDHRAALASFQSAVVAGGGDRAAMAAAIERADLLHVAAHGRFRADNPMFSSVRLTDGHFALHELADFDRVPAVVALAACDAGRSHHLGQGAEQLGTAPAWLSAGVETVVAPICAVPDETTAILFQHFYAALPGTTPADALARACAELADAGPALLGTAASFLCFGTGGPALGQRDPAAAHLTRNPPGDS